MRICKCHIFIFMMLIAFCSTLNAFAEELDFRIDIQEEIIEELPEEITNEITNEITEEITEEIAVESLEETMKANEEENTGSSELAVQEFLTEIAQNEGDTITLTKDLIWTDKFGSISLNLPTTINMGDYSIYVPKEMLFSASGPIRFVGNGVIKPMFYIDGFFNLNWAEIEAAGENATAVYASKDLDLYNTRIIAMGEGSVGIRGANLIQLYFSVIEGKKEAVVSETNNILIDSSNVSPLPQNAKIIQREAFPGYRVQENGFSVAANDPLSDAFDNFGGAGYYFLDVLRQEEIIGSYFNGVLENLPEDTSVPGEYKVICRPVGLPEWFPVELSPYEVPLHIVAENKPHIEAAYRMGTYMVALKFFQEIQEEKILWYSIDDGQTWLDFSELPDVISGSFGMSSDSLPINNLYLFKLEVVDGPMAGFSNTLLFPCYQSDPDSAGGGDRTGTDRFPLGSSNSTGNNLGNGDNSNEEDKNQEKNGENEENRENTEQDYSSPIHENSINKECSEEKTEVYEQEEVSENTVSEELIETLPVEAIPTAVMEKSDTLDINLLKEGEIPSPSTAPVEEVLEESSEVFTVKEKPPNELPEELPDEASEELPEGSADESSEELPEELPEKLPIEIIPLEKETGISKETEDVVSDAHSNVDGHTSVNTLSNNNNVTVDISTGYIEILPQPNIPKPLFPAKQTMALMGVTTLVLIVINILSLRLGRR